MLALLLKKQTQNGGSLYILVLVKKETFPKLLRILTLKTQYADRYLSPRLLNSISSRICRQNTQFNMYTTTSKQQEGCTFKDSHPKCFVTTNFDKFHREAFARGAESR